MAIDSIEVLDNLQFEHTTAAEIWAIDGEGSAFDAVKSYAVTIPPDISAARVIFNNNYDTAACQVHVRVLSSPAFKFLRFECDFGIFYLLFSLAFYFLASRQ